MHDRAGRAAARRPRRRRARPATPCRCSTSCSAAPGPTGSPTTWPAGLLGYTPDTLLDEVVDAFAAGDGAAVFGVVDKVIETGQDPRRFTEDLLRRLRDLVIVAAVPDAPATGLIDVSEDQGERLVAQAARFGSAELSRAADLVADRADRDARRHRAAAAARADLRPGAAARRRPHHRTACWPGSTGSSGGWRSAVRRRRPRLPPAPARRAARRAGPGSRPSRCAAAPEPEPAARSPSRRARRRTPVAAEPEPAPAARARPARRRHRPGALQPGRRTPPVARHRRGDQAARAG